MLFWAVMVIFYNAYNFECTIILTVKNSKRAESLPVIVWIILFSYFSIFVYISNVMIKILIAGIL